jgi:flagellar M-ring protein FliF
MPAWLQSLMENKNFALLAAAAGAGILLLLLGSFWMVLRARRKQANLKLAAQLAEAETQKQIAAPDLSSQLEAKIAEQSALKEQQARDVLATLKLPPVKTKKTEVLVKHISTEAKKDPAALAQVVRTWLNTSDYER